ncbi:hypothetical protein A4X13_0g1362 [Tilletia indica]|uniref:Bacterial surface antigen (D15) domain-containing protein n=1 Tax=Tilletia indica TaxID=43049 RepID=A0A177TVB3_9BASI|nr:hypothetical protein A4X13_0g1362 [Tilletia indica]
MSAPASPVEVEELFAPGPSPQASSSSSPSTDPAQDPYAPFTFDRTPQAQEPHPPFLTTEDGVPAEEETEAEAFPPKLKTRYFLKSSTDVGNGEASARLQGHLVHFLGGLETLQGSASVGSRTRRALDLNFTTPIRWNPHQIFTAGLFSFERDNTKFSSAREAVWGGRASLLLVDAMGDQHDFVYEAACRNIGKLVPGASIGLRQQARTTSKSSLSYTYTRDSRDSQLEPEFCTKGSLFRSVIEVAGPGGDARFVKLGTESTLSRGLRRIGEGWSTTLSARAGLLRTTNNQPSDYPDRSHLGGPTSVRMFSHNGLGPKSGRDSLGGDAHWSVGAEVAGPVWFGKAQWPLKWHLFINAGQLAFLDQSSNSAVAASLRTLTQPSLSAGAGIVFRQGPLRLEVNAGVPLVAHRSDSSRRGFQVGIGIDFL